MGFYSLDDSEKTKSSKDEDVIGYNLAVHPTGVPLRFTPAGDFIVRQKKIKCLIFRV